MSKDNQQSTNKKKYGSGKREERNIGLPTTPQNIKPPPVKPPKKENDKK